MACKGLLPAENPCHSVHALGTRSPDVHDQPVLMLTQGPSKFWPARSLNLLRMSASIRERRCMMSGWPSSTDASQWRNLGRFFFLSSAAPAGSSADEPRTKSSVRRALMLDSAHPEARLSMACRRVCRIGWLPIHHMTSSEMGCGTRSAVESPGGEDRTKMRRSGIQSVIF